MNDQASSKKYIETRVRNLPIHKCLVNADWETSSMANVIVMRRHVNNNVSGGVFLVDLQCLGVKDTIWFFNEDETEMLDRFNGDALTEFKTIDYDLAHNIVYAGHDFAMDFEIQPHLDFKTTRFVLEDDNESIPLIEISTGYGEEGIPHLMAYYPGQYADALSKLKKNAGEGNYLYTVGMDTQDDINDAKEDGLSETDRQLSLDLAALDEPGMVPLADFADGELTLENVQQVRLADLADEAKVAARNTMEKMVCLTEMMVRILPDDFYKDEEWAETEWNELEKAIDLPNGITDKEFEEWKILAEKNATDIDEIDGEATEQLSDVMLEKHGHNPFVACMAMADAIFAGGENADKLLSKWKPVHGHLPVFQLLEAFNEGLKTKTANGFNGIADSNHIKDAFPAITNFNELEFALFHALQVIKFCRLRQLSVAVQHYNLTAATGIMHILFMPMMDELLGLLQGSTAANFG